MIKKILSLLLIALFVPTLVVSNPVFAQGVPLPGNADGSIGAGDGRGVCNWDQLLEQIGCQETGFVCGGGSCPKSCDKQYTTLSDRSNDPSWGKWQFTPSTWAAVTGTQYPQCQGISNAISVECRPAQKWATEQYFTEAQNWLKSQDWCGPKLGQTITGTHQGTTKTCQVNKSGLISAYHNAGRNACVFANGNSRWSSQINWRICDAANIPFPEDCDPQTQPPTVSEEVTPVNVDSIERFKTPFEHPSHFNSLSESLKAIWVGTLQIMTSQLTAIMTQQVMAVGSFFDAKQQLELQRLHRAKHAQANKDYHPSEQMCEIGTFSRNLANTEKRAELTKTAMAESSLSRLLGTGDITTSDEFDKKSKMVAYLDTYCSPNDNGGQNSIICNNKDATRMNADINFTQTISMPLTIPLNMLDDDTKPEEQNLFALMDNLVAHKPFPWKSKGAINQLRFRSPYQEMRSIIAMRSVVQNSFSHILSEKTESPEKLDESNAPFIKAFMREMGLNDEEITTTIGENPSYYAQMEVITKKIYQHPEFIANLYDKPANVKRMKAALTAIKLMQDRDIHNALQRREMLMSILLELQLRKDQQELLSQDIPNAIQIPNLPNTNPDPGGRQSF